LKLDSKASLADDATRQITGLMESNSALKSAYLQAAQEQKHWRTMYMEAQEKSRKTEQAMAQRLESLQEECQNLNRRIGEQDLQLEETAKLRDDARELSQQKEAELETLRSEHTALLEETGLKEAALTQQLDDLRELHQTISEQVGQLEWEHKQKELAWTTEREQLDSENSALQGNLDELQQELQKSTETA
ncbi:MAG: hypothetical protein ABR497_10145, partial [Kiritimatiellia bacterium]